MRRFITVVSACFLIACSVAESARADLLVPLTQQRQTRVFTFVDEEHTTNTDVAQSFGPFVSNLTLQPTPLIGASATQNTSISSSTIEGSVFAQSQCVGTMFDDYAEAESDLIVRFQITQPVTYVMQGTFETSGTNWLTTPPKLHLTRDTINGITVDQVHRVPGTFPFFRSGQLLPGVYALRAYAPSGSYGGDFSGYTVGLDFNFTVTPSAGAWPMFLMAAISRRRRRRGP
jgi:hypothetical protein